MQCTPATSTFRSKKKRTCRAELNWCKKQLKSFLWMSLTPFLMLSLLSSCQKQSLAIAQSKNYLRLSMSSDPPTILPPMSNDSASAQVIGLCFRGLTYFSPEGVKMGVADSIESFDDYTRFIIHLKKTFWSDGMPVLASDFENSWKSSIAPSSPSVAAFIFYFIKNAEKIKNSSIPLSEVGIKVIDEQTIELLTEYPTPHLASLLASTALSPIPTHKINPDIPLWQTDAKDLVFNGPFILAKWHRFDKMVFEKNPYFFEKDRIHIEKIDMMILPDEITALHLFETNHLDLLGSGYSDIPQDAIANLAQDSKLHFQKRAVFKEIHLNTLVPLLQNKKIRKALSLALSRTEIIEHVVQLPYTPSLRYFPDLIMESDRKFPIDQSYDEARKLYAEGLSELGLKEGSISLLYKTSQNLHKIAQAIQQQWNKVLGIEVILLQKEWGVLLHDLSSKQFEAIFIGAAPSYDDPATFLEPYINPKSKINHSSWSDPRFEQAFESAKFCSNWQQRQRYYEAAEDILMLEMPSIPLYVDYGVYLKNPRLQGEYVDRLAHMNVENCYFMGD